MRLRSLMQLHWAWALAALMCGCTAPRGPVVVTDPDPSIKIPAMKQAVRSGDRKAVPQMIHDLGSDDPAVRFFAIQSLERLLKMTFGYDYYQDRDQRRPAVDRWKQWQAAQEWKNAQH